MIFKNIKPITSSRRHLLQLNKKHLAKKPFLKTEISGIKNNAGRNNSGKITIFHKGGGVKQKYRTINFTRTTESTGIICSIEHDPNRSAFIAAVFNYLENTFYYILASQNLKIGDVVKSGENVELSLSNSLPLERIPSGTLIHNILPKVFAKAQLSRSAGAFSVVKEKTKTAAVIKLNSGEHRFVSLKCFASIGKVSNSFYYLSQSGKAGRSRWLNIRPTVRGVAMNPIDHPHGGGEGKKSGKSLSPWGKHNKKGKTGKTNNLLIIHKRK
jgi:large subunit ribosomal protein L2